MKAAELREKTSEELNKELLDLLREQFNLRMQQGTGRFSRHDQFSKVRKNVARIKTVLNERSMASIA